MIRLTWRQFRTQAVAAAGALAVIAVALAITGPRLDHLYQTSIVPCQARGDCSQATTAFLSHYGVLQGVGLVLVVVPAIIGVFWGAPLVARELETGSYKLAWTQGVSRRRWLAVKLGLVGMSSIAVAGLLSLMVTWWFSPIDRVNADPFTVFDQRDVVPFGYAVFAFALGVTAGLLLRRTLPAMAVALAGFAAVRVTVREWVRPYLLAPLRITSALWLSIGKVPAPPHPGDWVLSDLTVNAAGRVIGQDGAISYGGTLSGILFHPEGGGRAVLKGVGLCPNRFPALAGAARSGQPNPLFQQAAQECVARLGVRSVLTYQPTSHYWPLQWCELAIFVGLALALAGFCFWRLGRRRT